MAEITFGQVLQVAPSSDVLTDVVKGHLCGTWGETDATVIGGKHVVVLAGELAAILPAGEFDTDKCFAVAEAIVALLERLKLVPQAPAEPQTVKIVGEKRPKHMSLDELLAELAKNASQYPQLRRYIEAQLEELRVRVDTWVIPGADGGVDIPLTLQYATWLGKPGSSPQRLYNGRRPTTLARALKIDDRLLVHPLSRRATPGLDPNEFDISSLPVDLVEALRWAPEDDHPAWPGEITDLYRFTEELFATTLPRRWRRIQDDYLAARENGEESAQRVRRFWPEGMPTDQPLPIGGRTTSDSPRAGHQRDTGLLGWRREEPAAAPAVDYMALIRRAATGVLVVGGRDQNYDGNAVYSSIEGSGRDNDITAYVIGDGYLGGRDNNGTLFTLHGVNIQIGGRDNNVRVVHLTPEQFARRVRLIQ